MTTTREQVMRAMSRDAAYTAAQVATLIHPLGEAWRERQNVRNRLNELVAKGSLIRSEDRPARYAINELAYCWTCDGPEGGDLAVDCPRCGRPASTQ